MQRTSAPNFFRDGAAADSLEVPTYGNDAAVLVIRAHGDPKWVEIRGRWDVDETDVFQRAIDGLNPRHVSGIFSAGVEVVHRAHESWAWVLALWTAAG